MLASRIHDATVGPARLLMLPVGVPDVVSFRGSFESAPDLGADDDIVLSVIANLLDKGTAHRDRFALAEALDDRGAQISFYADGLRMGFSGRALRADLADVIALAAEQLREPAFDPDEVEKALVRAVAGVRRSLESTGGQASGALSRRLYGPAHPNYALVPAEEIAALEALTPDVVRDHHAAHVGSDDLTITFAGDVDASAVESAVSAALGDWAPHGRTPVFDTQASPEAPGRTVVEMADRRNLDVRLGHAVALRRDDPDFLATYAGIFALGGNFSSRLMQTVRDEQGLTYGIGASLGSASVRHDAHLRVSVTLSQENVLRGIAATRAEVDAFVEEGVSEATLAAVRTTLAGTHVVGMATTSGVAARLLVNAERGFDVGYLDRYPELIHALTPEAVTEAVRRHVRPDDLHEAIAGTMPTDATAS